VVRRPVEEDGKELQAVGAAIGAMAESGHPAAVPHLRAVLLTEDESLAGDCQWDAADALGRLVGQPFRDAPDRVRAARDWLAAHADSGEAAEPPYGPIRLTQDSDSGRGL